jgi:hypothetical protein
VENDIEYGTALSIKKKSISVLNKLTHGFSLLLLFSLLYLFHFRSTYLLFNIHSPKGLTGTAWEPSQPKVFPHPVNVLSLHFFFILPQRVSALPVNVKYYAQEC